jgi:hypothetical protein
MQMMEEQMTQMEAVMRDMDGACPMDGKGGMGMMGGGMRHGGGMGATGMQDAMAKRLEALEKRVDMMQTLIQQQGAPAARP